MYSRTRPADRQKVLVTEKQTEEIEAQWSKVHEAEEEANLMENPEFAKAKADLTKEFGKEPSLNDVKWRVYNENAMKHALDKRWYSYRRDKLELGRLLEKEGKNKQALEMLFEVIYLDVNGCRNRGPIGGLSSSELDELGIEEFVPRPNWGGDIVIYVQWLIEALNMSEKEAEELFISTNKNKPSKKMPIPEDEAWQKLLKEIKTNKANAKIVEDLDTGDIDSVIREIKGLIKAGNRSTLNSVVYDKFRGAYKTKKTIIPNTDGIKRVIKILLDCEENTGRMGVSTLLFYLGKDKGLFSDIAEKYLKQNKKKFEKCPEDLTIGEFGKISPEWVKDLIPIMIKQLQKNPEWGTRQNIAVNLGLIGSKHPGLVKEAIPIMMDYIEHPRKITKRKVKKIESNWIKISVNMSPETMLEIDETQRLRNAYIDSVEMIARGDKDFISKYKPLFSKIAKKDKSEYSRKKAQNVLDLL